MTLQEQIVECVSSSDLKSQMALGKALQNLRDTKSRQYNMLCRIPFIRILFDGIEDLDDIRDGMMEQYCDNHRDEFSS